MYTNSDAVEPVKISLNYYLHLKNINLTKRFISIKNEICAGHINQLLNKLLLRICYPVRCGVWPIEWCLQPAPHRILTRQATTTAMINILTHDHVPTHNYSSLDRTASAQIDGNKLK